jgi:hypothetical protein
MSVLDDLLTAYRDRVSRPWQDALAGPQRVWFVIYEPAQERRLRLRLHDFEIATIQAGHGWKHLDLTDAFPEWLGKHDYREEYFAEPEYLTYELASFADHVASQVNEAIAEGDGNSVVALSGLAGLFGVAKVSVLVETVASSVKGRLILFFPGHYDTQSYYRLLDARDGWDYRAVPITAKP